MEIQDIIFLLLVSSLAFVSNAEDEVVACTTSESECRNDGWSALSVINDRFFCCGAGQDINWDDNNTCTCVQRAEGVEACDEGTELCANASTVTVNVHNVTRCCQDGFGMQSVTTSVNGAIVTSCTCSQYVHNNETGAVSTGNAIFISNIQTGPGANISDLLDDLLGLDDLHESGDRIREEVEDEMEALAEEMDEMLHGLLP